MRVPPPSDPGATPSEHLRVLEEIVGAPAIVQWCADLLGGRVAADDPDLPSLVWLGGASAAAELPRGTLVRPSHEYWPRVWGARGLLHVWDPASATVVAVPALRAALGDPAWRVREMTAKVARRWQVAELAEGLEVLVADQVPRVRAAAARALGGLGEFEQAAALRRAADDEDPAVRRAAEAALDELGRRLERDVRRG